MAGAAETAARAVLSRLTRVGTQLHSADILLADAVRFGEAEAVSG